MLNRSIVLVSALLLLWAGRGDAFDGEIAFAYPGGSYFVDRAEAEYGLAKRFIQAIFNKAGVGGEDPKIKIFSTEDDLYRALAEKRVVVAAMPYKFYIDHAQVLQLEPLVAPKRGGSIYREYHFVGAKDNAELQDIGDLAGKKLAVASYNHFWYFPIVAPDAPITPEQLLKLPDLLSVLMAVVYKKADVAFVPQGFLEQITMLKPFLGRRIRVIGSSKPFLSPPFVSQTGRLTPAEKDRVIQLFIDAEDDPDTAVLLEMFGFDGFERVTDEQIRRVVK